MGPDWGRDGQPGGKKDRPQRSHTGRTVRTILLATGYMLFPGPSYAAEGALSADFVFTLIVIAAAALALAAGVWALAGQRDVRRLRQALAATTAKARAMLAARDALIGAGRESVIVWGTGLADPISFGGGAQMIEACLTGPDSMPLALALDVLAEQGVPFTTTARTRDGRIVNLRGRPAGGFAAVYLEEDTKPSAEPDYRGLLDALPIPAWLRARDLSLVWANRAFLSASGATTVEGAIAENAALDRSERDLASAARGQGNVVEARALCDARRHAPRARLHHDAPFGRQPWRVRPWT